MEKELEELRRLGKREPERPSTFEQKPSIPKTSPQPQPETRQSRGVVTEEQEEEV